jgi:hypothetical protein
MNPCFKYNRDATDIELFRRPRTPMRVLSKWQEINAQVKEKFYVWSGLFLKINKDHLCPIPPLLLNFFLDQIWPDVRDEFRRQIDPL